MENKDNKPYRDDEFDVEMLASQLYNIGRKIADKLWYPFQLVIRKPIITMMWLICGALLSFVLSQVIPKTFEGQFILEPYDNQDFLCINLLDDLSYYALNDDPEQLANALGISEDDAERISSLNRDVIWKNGANDSIRFIAINVTADDNEQFDVIQDGVKTFLENNVHYKFRREARIKRNKAVYAKLSQEINQLDSLKKSLREQLKTNVNSGVVYGKAPDALPVHQTSLAFYFDQLRILESQAHSESFKLVKPIISSSKAVSPKLLDLLLWIMPIVLFGSLIHAHKAVSKE